MSQSNVEPTADATHGAPWNDSNSWHTAALRAVSEPHEGDDAIFVVASAEEDGSEFVYARLSRKNAEELHVQLHDVLTKDEQKD